MNDNRTGTALAATMFFIVQKRNQESTSFLKKGDIWAISMVIPKLTTRLIKYTATEVFLLLDSSCTSFLILIRKLETWNLISKGEKF